MTVKSTLWALLLFLGLLFSSGITAAQDCEYRYGQCMDATYRALDTCQIQADKRYDQCATSCAERHGNDPTALHECENNCRQKLTAAHDSCYQQLFFRISVCEDWYHNCCRKRYPF
ncbi:MAG: hypothetical protein EHM45_08620 [Desulfobacteraceae bacterium]|nr:MAG: hypothetical protein EHM45_08620 [Desulfobacteraceae bacterium]